MPVQIEIVFFAVIAAVMLFMLYNVLGKKVGRQPQEDAKAPPPAPAEGAALAEPGARSAVDSAVIVASSALKARDPNFDPAKFLDGSRQAYETIVRGYASGDRSALKPLLAPEVMTSFEAGITARETRGETEEVEFLHGPRADLETTEVKDDRAIAKVRFLAEIRSRISASAAPSGSEPRIEERRTAEHWTFTRKLGASDPNWVLARVEPASA